MIKEKLIQVKSALNAGNLRIMIVGLGSVGCYLLDYLCSMADERIEIIVVGRNKEKLISDVNIITVASIIRQHNRSQVRIVSDCDLNSVSDIEQAIVANKPHFIVNSSRVYAGLKYGSISWNNFRAYGVWAPLSIKFIKNIMAAVHNSGLSPIIVNTSYSDAVNAWLKTSGSLYPDFGSGNLNHLIPRVKLAAAHMMNVSDFYNIDVTIATSHFHDVVISKEGHNQGQDILLHLEYHGKQIQLSQNELLGHCNIAMPTDAKRNMMNASSNFDVVASIVSAVDSETQRKFHSPGAMGEIGGYPLIVDGKTLSIDFDESVFSMATMRLSNQHSLYLDGIERVEDGTLYYTDELIERVKAYNGTKLPKAIAFNEIDVYADYLIQNIIEKR